MSDQKVHRVLVIGAGSAGLLTAQALQMQGAQVTVFEQDASLDARPRDWNFGIYWAQVPLQDCLPEHLQKEVENAQVDEHRAGPDEVMPIFNGATEELMRALPIPYNIRLARKRFLRLISQGIDIQYGKKLKEVSSDGKAATAIFEDGTSATGDLLIGTEGSHSVVRSFLLGPEKAANVPSPLVNTACMAKLPAEAAEKFKAYANRLMIAFHPNGYFQWVGVHDAYEGSKPGDWTFMILQSWKSGPDYDPSALDSSSKILADMKKRSKEFGPGFDSMIQAIPEETQCWHGRLSYWNPESWDNHGGTVTLGGDAAHSMTYHRGQGLNNAIHDVALLAQKIKEGGFTPAAIGAYETEMIPRAQEAVNGSNGNSMAVHDWDTLLKSPLFTTGLKQK